ncbi:MAG: GNAT family N-acetyltransferase [Chloroflexi bacterium]|nr:GNAT family N-acetyltransferase [Chloroflexota bacterium]
MTEYVLRAALETESAQIKALIHLTGINPTGLDWKRFLVAVDEKGRVIGCGQIKPHGGDIRELASIAVHPDHQGRGIARAVIERLLKGSPRPLYLTCLSVNEGLYQKFGFHTLSYESMPRYFQKLARFFQMADVIRRSGNELRVMMLE